ncbi:MAG TPA: C45 family autoproteolytic acyltransferase/hydrolase, partial [Phycisphaerae bacterium]|nr:C45 family autoproteolytic acyltransferase/hydrolase [Phycisphaerae bacterium]
LVNAAFLRRFDKEYLEEMQGIADGAASAGAKFDERPIDITDIAALNLWAELMTLDGALEATPTGLEGVKFPNAAPHPQQPDFGGHCSAFAATGPATADGKIVFGHISMFDLYPSSFFNVWLDVKPAKGNRVVMQTYPGGIYSGMDYYINSAGIVACETTIDQTRYSATGETLCSRMRRAMQYGNSIDEVVSVLTSSNNGLYTNEWLLADTKTNEIAMFELGTSAQKLYRSSRNDWFGGTEGFYWGCNNTKDLAVRLDTSASTKDRPANMIWRPTDRDITWQRLYAEHKGKIDDAWGRMAFTMPPLCAYPSLDAKVTTTAMAGKLQSWALFGPPMGRTWKPTPREMREYPEVQPMVGNPWTVITTDFELPLSPKKPAEDLAMAKDSSKRDDDEKWSPPLAKTPWHGTILPKTDGDIWLAAAFADYAAIVGREQAAGKSSDEPKTCPCNDDHEQMGLSIQAARARYLQAVAIIGDRPLTQVKRSADSQEWYRLAEGKGVLALHALRMLQGDDKFFALMDKFGTDHAGKEVSCEEFMQEMMNLKSGEKDARQIFGDSGAFPYWLPEKGLPLISIGDVRVESSATGSDTNKAYCIRGSLVASCCPRLTSRIDVTLEYVDGSESMSVDVGEDGSFSAFAPKRPNRIMVDKFGELARANGPWVPTTAFMHEVEKTIIVRGTTGDEAANREAAEVLQKRIIAAWYNHPVPIKSDSDVNEDELKNHHVILIGRPATNSVAAKWQSPLPVEFGSQSFSLNGDTYAHFRTAVACAAENPLNKRYTTTVIAGLSAAATYRACDQFFGYKQDTDGPVVLYDRSGCRKVLPTPAKELIRDLAPPDKGTVAKGASETHSGAAGSAE